MSALEVLVRPDACTFAFDGRRFVAPVGVATLQRTQLGEDPPSPEELTNAIGAVLDHLDDVVREVDGVLDADEVVVAGPEQHAIACVEVGGPVDLPFTISRDAAEDVFRTVATERRADRARNPGLAAEHVDGIVAGSCVLVAIMRRLRLEAVTIADEDAVLAAADDDDDRADGTRR